MSDKHHDKQNTQENKDDRATKPRWNHHPNDNDNDDNNNTNNTNNTDDHGMSPPPLFQHITEGSVQMKYPADQASTVFYNPVQVQNRDLSILIITLFAQEKRRAQQQQQQQQIGDAATTRGIDILDALAASGLRSIRYWKEMAQVVRHVTINDLDEAAVQRAHDNLRHNHVHDHQVGGGGVVVVDQKDNDDDDDNDGNNKATTASSALQRRRRPAGIRVQRGDAIQEMYHCRQPAVADLPSANSTKPAWDVIDLDPYGSAAPFLDAAIQAVVNGGLLCVTCTDMAALGGSHPETCYGRYNGSMPIPRAPYLQEMALRILLQCMASTAAKYGRIITPRLSVGMHFYIRVFVTVHESKAAVNELSRHIGKVYQSTQCQTFVTVPDAQMGGKKGTVYQPGRAPGSCPDTGGPFKVGGPIWLGPLHDADLLKRALDRLTSTDPDSKPDLKYIATKDRLRGLLQSCAEELPDVPLFYRPTDMASLLKTSTPPLDDIRSALINAGYRVSGYHKDPLAIKTDAPSHVMWDILRAWCQKHPPKKPPPEGSAGHKILQTQSQTNVDFGRPKQGGLLKKRTDVARFPMNPEANWGPKKAATGHKRKAESASEKEVQRETKS